MRKWNNEAQEVDATRLRWDPRGPSLPLPLLFIVGGLLLMGIAIGGLLALQDEKKEKEAALRVEGVIVDAETGRPVDADVYLDGRLLYTNVRSFAVEVPSGSELRVEAPGYEPWAFRLRYRLREGYRFHGPVRLTPVYKAAEDEHGAKKLLGEK
jgi:hypothetical protein